MAVAALAWLTMAALSDVRGASASLPQPAIRTAETMTAPAVHRRVRERGVSARVVAR
jgi:hypothetical protein